MLSPEVVLIAAAARTVVGLPHKPMAIAPVVVAAMSNLEESPKAALKWESKNLLYIHIPNHILGSMSQMKDKTKPSQ